MKEPTGSFSITPSSDYLTISVRGECDSSNISEFTDQINVHLNQSVPNVIVNCEHLFVMTVDWFRALAQVQMKLRSFKKEMRFIHLKNPIMNNLKANGMEGAFKYSPNLKEALKAFGLAPRKVLDTEFINPFLDATLRVLDVQAGINAVAGQIFLKKEQDRFIGDVSGVIGIVSDNFTGSVVISFPEKTFLKIMSAMLSEECTEVNKDIIDGAGEITNMIFGQAKIILNEKGYGIKTAIPSVVTGKDHTLSQYSQSPVVVIPFKSNAGDFFVEICITN